MYHLVSTVAAFAQMLTYLFGFVRYAQLIPELRALGSALLVDEQNDEIVVPNSVIMASGITRIERAAGV